MRNVRCDLDIVIIENNLIWDDDPQSLKNDLCIKIYLKFASFCKHSNI